MKKKGFAFYSLFLIAAGLSAQSHTDAAGGNASGSGGSISYSVGQIDYRTKSGTGGVITEGVQQPYEITEITTGINEPTNTSSFSAVAFPNPTSGTVELQISSSTGSDQFTYELFDINGNSIKQGSITGNTARINMASLSGGTYFLRVVSSDKAVKTFRIIKTI
jgi:hypothetical protein